MLDQDGIDIALLYHTIIVQTKTEWKDPELAAAYFGRGNSKVCLEQLEEAAEDYVRALQINQDFAEARRALDAVEAQLGRSLEDLPGSSLDSSRDDGHAT